MLMIAFLDEPQMVWMVLLGFLLLGLIFPHLGQSPYGAALLSHTEKQHQDCPPGEKARSLNLFKSNYFSPCADYLCLIVIFMPPKIIF